MFSSRVTGALEPNRLTRTVQRLRTTGASLIDLTVTNPTLAGIEYPVAILEALADARSLRYEPAALGLIEARSAVARDYGRLGIKVAPERVVVTASTSEAYSILFKLLCAPGGDAVMPGFLERDEGERERETDRYAWDGVSGVRPFHGFAKTTTVGVY